MYGTVARLPVKPGMAGKLEELVREFEATLEVDDATDIYLYQAVQGSGDWHLVIASASSPEMYMAAAAALRQQPYSTRLDTLLAGPPEWRDSTIVYRGRVAYDGL
jgi:hypothetical protein